MTTDTPLTRSTATNGALASGFVTAELHHLMGHDRCALRVIGVLSASTYLPDGLLIASDTQSRTNLFHFTPSEITAIFDAFLKDEVRIASDGYLDADKNFQGTGKVFATRE